MVSSFLSLIMIRTYTQLQSFPTYKERLEYLSLKGKIGEETFGFDRYFNQLFYKSSEWKRVRDYVIIRDLGCDLGISDREIDGKILVHHMNPISMQDIKSSSDFLLNPEYLISTSKLTHDLIHYGYCNPVELSYTERKPNDTCPWKE